MGPQHYTNAAAPNKLEVEHALISNGELYCTTAKSNPVPRTLWTQSQ